MRFTDDKTRLTIPAIVSFHGKPMLSVEFIIDTGSPETMVDEFYTSQRRIFANNLTLHKEIVLGGDRIQLYSSGVSVIKFRDETGNLVSIETTCLDVAKNLGSLKGGTQMYSGVNIIGLSLLLETKSKFFMDIANNIAYFEIP